MVSGICVPLLYIMVDENIDFVRKLFCEKNETDFNDLKTLRESILTTLQNQNFFYKS